VENWLWKRLWIYRKSVRDDDDYDDCDDDDDDDDNNNNNKTILAKCFVVSLQFDL